MLPGVTNPSPLSQESQTLLAFLEEELAKGRAMGDIQTMLAALWNKRKKPSLEQEPTRRPAGYRSTTFPKYIYEKFGARLLRWGATAIRGDLGEEKAHIVKFIELVNALPVDQAELEQVFDLAAGQVADVALAEEPAIELPPVEDAQRAFESLLRTPSRGKVQQGLVFALLWVLYEDEAEITVATKAVFAGDAQSGVAGDVVVTRENQVAAAYEVKAMKLDLLSFDQSVRTHGTVRDYPLVILATGFPPNLPAYKDVYLITLEDFCLSIFTEIVAHYGLAAKDAIRRTLTVYNERFVSTVERDLSLRVVIDF